MPFYPKSRGFWEFTPCRWATGLKLLSRDWVPTLIWNQPFWQKRQESLGLWTVLSIVFWVVKTLFSNQGLKSAWIIRHQLMMRIIDMMTMLAPYGVIILSHFKLQGFTCPPILMVGWTYKSLSSLWPGLITWHCGSVWPGLIHLLVLWPRFIQRAFLINKR